jgi:hypothetical protein
LRIWGRTALCRRIYFSIESNKFVGYTIPPLPVYYIAPLFFRTLLTGLISN